MPKSLLHDTLPLPSKLRQIDGLQVLRALAVAQIAWAHAAEILPLEHASFTLGIFGVDVFFVISGFILCSIVLHETAAPGPRTAWGFLKRRILRIYPIYWLICLVYLARLLHDGQTLSPDYLFSALLLPSPLHTTQLQLFAFGWTLIFELFFYLLLAFLLSFTVRRAVPILMLVLTALVVIGQFVTLRHPILIILLNPMLMEFVYGAAIALLYRRLKSINATRFNRSRARVMGGGVSILTGLAIARQLGTGPHPKIANGMQMILAGEGVWLRILSWGLCAAMVVGGVVLWDPKLRSRAGRVLLALGAASYSGYLVSPLALEFGDRLLRRVLGAATTPAAQSVYVWLITLIVLCAGWLLYNFVEWPLLRALQQRFLGAGRSR
jgi:exopolysaccharide production protein ExoZ